MEQHLARGIEDLDGRQGGEILPVAHDLARAFHRELHVFFRYELPPLPCKNLERARTHDINVALFLRENGDPKMLFIVVEIDTLEISPDFMHKLTISFLCNQAVGSWDGMVNLLISRVLLNYSIPQDSAWIS